MPHSSTGHRTSAQQERERTSDVAVADIRGRTAWKDYHQWFAAQADERGLAPRRLHVQPRAKTRRGFWPRLRKSAIEVSFTSGWQVSLGARHPNITQDGLRNAIFDPTFGEHYFVTTGGMIHRLVATDPPTASGPLGHALSPAVRQPGAGETMWTDGASLGENLAVAMTDLLDQHSPC